MRNDRLSRRVAALQSFIRPADSIFERIEQLSPNDRRIYEDWCIERADWIKSFAEPSSAYRSFLNGNEGPNLPWHIAVAIYGKPTEFPKSMTLKDVMNLYEELK